MIDWAMTDIAIWLLRWTIAGAALSAVVIVVAYALERLGRTIGPRLYRLSLIAALAAPLVAFAPPVLEFDPIPESFAETDVPAARPMIEPAGPRAATTAPIVEAEGRGDWRRAALDGLALALVGLWAAGVAFAVLRRQHSAMQLSRAFRSGAPYPTAFVDCRLSADTRTPLVFGLLRPRMLAPADFSEWSPAEREAVLRHEAAHLRRGDLTWAAIGDAVSVLYWWAPPVALLTRQHLLATEEACDAASLGLDEDRHGYARTLLAITRRVGRHATPGLAMTGPSLRRRIDRLISPQEGFPLAAPLAAIVGGASVVLALCAPAAALGDGLRIYIFDAAGGASSTYALSDGERATAVVVERCVGRLMPDAVSFVNRMEGRIKSGKPDELEPVWVIGPGSRTELGPCRPDKPVDEEDDEDSLVMIVDATDAQARRFIRQMDFLSDTERKTMLEELGLAGRR